MRFSYFLIALFASIGEEGRGEGMVPRPHLKRTKVPAFQTTIHSGPSVLSGMPSFKAVKVSQEGGAQGLQKMLHALKFGSLSGGESEVSHIGEFQSDIAPFSVPTFHDSHEGHPAALVPVSSVNPNIGVPGAPGGF